VIRGVCGCNFLHGHERFGIPARSGELDCGG